MLENVSILIPFQTDHGPRARAFEWVKRYYANMMPEAELCIGEMNGGEMNKSKAVNLAAQKATRDIFVIADADIVYDPKLIDRAIRRLHEAAWVIPFTEIINIEYHGVERLFNTQQPRWPFDVRPEECTRANWIYNGFAGKLFVIPRINFDAVRGFDERFIGWGGEDDAFSHSVRTLCGKPINIEGRIFHLWHPASSYKSNPHGKANGDLLNRYERASGKPEEIIKLINERNYFSNQNRPNSIGLSNEFIKNTSISQKGKICFSILVHNNRELVEQLIDNVRHYCPNSAIVLYNGGDDPVLCNGLGVPVCPTSRKLERGWTTIYFLETMEWIEEQGIQYDYFINLDSDALFIKKGYEEFIQSEMQTTDYLAVKMRTPEPDWYIGNEIKKDIQRWGEIFNVNHFLGIFNVGQVISRPLVKALLQPERKNMLKKALLETVSFGTDEVLFVNIARELGFRIKKYPDMIGDKMIRYRPFFTLNEMLRSLNNNSGWLCHPVIRDKNNQARKLILYKDSEQYTKQYKNREYPWHQDNPDNYAVSLPIKSKFGNTELIARSYSSLAHYWQHPDGYWTKSETFAEGVTGNPLFYENTIGHFGAVCKLETGGVGFWYRDNLVNGYPWFGPSIILSEDTTPVMLSQLQDGRYLLVCESCGRYDYWVRNQNTWVKNPPLTE